MVKFESVGTMGCANLFDSKTLRVIVRTNGSVSGNCIMGGHKDGVSMTHAELEAALRAGKSCYVREGHRYSDGYAYWETFLAVEEANAA